MNATISYRSNEAGRMDDLGRVFHCGSSVELVDHQVRRSSFSVARFLCLTHIAGIAFMPGASEANNGAQRDDQQPKDRAQGESVSRIVDFGPRWKCSHRFPFSSLQMLPILMSSRRAKRSHRGEELGRDDDPQESADRSG